MVNLTFYGLDVPYLIISDNSEAHIFYFHFHIPSAGRSFMLEFLFWSFKGICFGAFQIACGLFGHLLFGFRFQERSAFLLILRVNQFFRWSWIMIRYAGCFGIMMDFFKQPQASVQIAAMKSFWTFWVLFDYFGWFCLLLCLRIILTWNPFDYHISRLLLVVHQRIYCLGISSLWL